MLQRVRDLKVQFNNGTLDARRQGRDRRRGRRRSPRRSRTSRRRPKFNGTALLDGHDRSRSRSAPTTARRSSIDGGRPRRRHRGRRPVGPDRPRRAAPPRRALAPAARSPASTTIDTAIKNVSTARAELRRGPEPPRAPPEQPGDLPGEPDGVRVADPRRGHGVGDDEVHEAQHPAAGRHEHARAGQPGPAGRSVAPALGADVTPPRTDRGRGSRPLAVSRSLATADDPVEATWSRLSALSTDQQGVLNHGPSYPEQHRGVQHASPADGDGDRRPRSRWRSSRQRLPHQPCRRRRGRPRASREKMRGQIGGLAQAQRNAQDGISLVQTAEGALTEVHSMLQRVRDLKVQFNNGTLEHGRQGRDRRRGRPDRQGDHAASVADTKFNGTALLDGQRRSRSRSAPTTARRSRRPATSLGRHVAPAASRAVVGLSAARPRRGLASSGSLALDDDRRRRSRTCRRPARSFGAVQNRLEHRLNNLATYQENLTASESRIRDVDMASEMTKFTKLQHPAAGRHEHARAGQPGPAGRPVAARASKRSRVSRRADRPLSRQGLKSARRPIIRS